MFVRKRKNRSGSTSIQIIDKSQGRFTVVEHIGTSSDPEELAYLFNLAKSRISEIQSQLSFFSGNKHQEITSWLARFQHSETIWIGYEEVFGKIFDEIGYDKLFNNPLLRRLVIARIAYPESKLSTVDWLNRKFSLNLSKNQIYRLMDVLDSNIEREVADHTFKFFGNILKHKIHIIFFDATTLHFETFKSDSFRLTGFSKAGKHNQPQVVIGLMVTEEGLPIGYDVYPGNQFDGHTIRSALTKVQRRYEVEDVVFVADASMMSRDNVKIIEEAGFKYIMAAKIKNMSQELEDEILRPSNYKDNIFETKYGKERLIVSFSPDRAGKDAQDRENNLAQIKKRIARTGKITKTKVGKIGKSKYLLVNGDAEVSINYQAVRDDERWDGLKGYVTNIPSKELTARDIIKKYVQLWQVERAFRISKDELKIRPIYHYKKQRIRAHILLVFMGLVVSGYTEYKLREAGISTRKLLTQLDGVQIIRIEDKQAGLKFQVRTGPSELISQVYEILDIHIDSQLKVLSLG